MIDFGFRFGQVLAATFLMGLVAGLSAYLVTFELISSCVVFAATCASFGSLSWLASRFLESRVSSPLRSALAALDARQQDLLDPDHEERTAPLLRTLLMRIAQDRAGSVDRQRLSEAKIVSVEAAFDRIHAVLQSLTEGIIVVDEQDRIVLANHSARNVLECSAKVLEGQPLIKTLNFELRAAVKAGLAEVIGSEHQVYRKSKLRAGARVYDLSIVPIRMQRMGGECGRVLLVVDVTKSFEISRLKDELLSTISHELRTPLTNICSSVEIMSQLNFEDREEWQEFCGVAKKEAMHLNGLVDAVIYYSQIETGKITWCLESFDIGELLANARRSMAAKAAEEDVTIEILSGDSVLPTHADHARTQDMILRLLDSAMKFTPGGGRIQLQAELCDDMVRVSIADSGNGIPQDCRERVFERFAQLGDMMTEKPVGTGLGLAICRRVAEAMGGKIWCEESRFRGACFRFELPAAEVVSAS